MNPQPYTTVNAGSSYDRCTTCHPHSWHGLKCSISGCHCESSWRDPEQVASWSESIPDRAPTQIWVLRADDYMVNVRTEEDDRIVIRGRDWGNSPAEIHLTRKDARLLAKRINQCLDATVKR